MKLIGSGNQQVVHPIYSADVTITGSAQLALPLTPSRCMLMLQNTSSTAAHIMSVEFGGARATATITSGAVTSVSVSNAGFGYTLPPSVLFLGGGGDTPNVGLGQPGGNAPHHPAAAHAVLSGSAIGSIVIDDPGANYRIAPYVMLINDPNDPYGAAIPSATSGLQLGPGVSLLLNGTACPTTPIAVLGTNAADVLLCRWME